MVHQNMISFAHIVVVEQTVHDRFCCNLLTSLLSQLIPQSLLCRLSFFNATSRKMPSRCVGVADKQELIIIRSYNCSNSEGEPAAHEKIGVKVAAEQNVQEPKFLFFSLFHAPLPALTVTSCRLSVSSIAFQSRSEGFSSRG